MADGTTATLRNEATGEEVDITHMLDQGVDEPREGEGESTGRALSEYAVFNMDQITPRNALLSAHQNIEVALTRPADPAYGDYRNLDAAYSAVLRASDDLADAKAMLRKLRAGAVASAHFTQIEMQFAPAR